MLAFFSKLAAILLTIPGPVLGAYLMLAMGMLFVSGWQTILRDGLDPRGVLVVVLASALGLGLHNHSIMKDLLGDELGGLLGNGVTIGAVVAIGMTLLLQAINTRRSRLEVTLDMASLPVIDKFLPDWHGMRLRRCGCVPPAKRCSPACRRRRTMLMAREHPRLLIDARPQVRMVELEFVATTRQENVEDQLAYLTDEVPISTFDDLSLRLLRCHASAVCHRKFHGVDIGTVQVEGSA